MFEKILEKYKKGELSVEEAEERIFRSFYEESDSFLLDIEREERLGFPEIIFAEDKKAKELLQIIDKILQRKNLVFISDADEEKKETIKKELLDLEIKESERLMVFKKRNYKIEDIGTVGIITGGSSDVKYAESCALLLEEMGAEVIKSYDRGISGIHRPFLSVRDTKNADVLIVFAGMDGVLPGLIGSATDKPIIGVPVPVGYGHGGGGEGALTTMLQSCVPGLVVVNIGNFVGAAAAAVRILRLKEK